MGYDSGNHCHVSDSYSLWSPNRWKYQLTTICSVFEMCVGIVVACLPATSRAWRDLSPAYFRLRDLINSATIISKTRIRFGSGSKSSIDGVLEKQALERSYYSNYGHPEQQIPEVLSQHPKKPPPTWGPSGTQTTIRCERQELPDNQGIYLTYELRQSIFHCTPPVTPPSEACQLDS